MKDNHTRFLKVGDLLERSGNGYQFKKRFTKEEIQENKHYLIKDQNIILQVNTDYSRIGCHDVGFDRVELAKLDEDRFYTIIKNLVRTGKVFAISLGLDDSDDEEYFMHDLRVLELGKDDPEEYLKRVYENREDMFQVLESVIVHNTTERYQVRVYPSGVAYYWQYRSKAKEDNGELTRDVLILLGNVLEYYDSLEELEEITMLEKGIVLHQYSKLHVLMSYLADNKEFLPPEVQDALDSGVETGLTKLGVKYKGAQVYDK